MGAEPGQLGRVVHAVPHALGVEDAPGAEPWLHQTTVQMTYSTSTSSDTTLRAAAATISSSGLT